MSIQKQRPLLEDCHTKWIPARCMSTEASVQLNMENDVVRFSVTTPTHTKSSSLQEGKKKHKPKRLKMSKKAKINQLKFYRLKAKKKINSPNPEVRIRYKLEKVGQLVNMQNLFMYTNTYKHRNIHHAYAFVIIIIIIFFFRIIYFHNISPLAYQSCLDIHPVVCHSDATSIFLGTVDNLFLHLPC